MTQPYLKYTLLLIGVLTAVIPVACLSQQRELARVNDEPITEETFRHELIIREGARLLLEMIDTQLITQAATQAGASVTDHEVDLKLGQAIARLGSERDFEELLRRNRRTKESFRETLRAEALLERLAIANHPLDDADLRQYYDAHKSEFAYPEQVRLRLMLFAQKTNADTVAAALREPGADFAGLAQAFSEDPATKDDGGDTGFISRGDFAKPIADRAFAMKPGQVSDVFEVPDGWAIIKLEAKRPAGVQPFASLRDTLTARVQVQHLDQARADWLKRARAAAQIKITDPFLDERVRGLIEANAPFEPSNLAPDLPMAPR
ncbi:MAG: peptidyl-prolyl cis-trans isomerase [Armatimonadetes bacterium]|nr:peptidyl-prolyl cis-trans isomerase [Armatimonadota bacterium]